MQTQGHGSAHVRILGTRKITPVDDDFQETSTSGVEVNSQSHNVQNPQNSLASTTNDEIPSRVSLKNERSGSLDSLPVHDSQSTPPTAPNDNSADKDMDMLYRTQTLQQQQDQVEHETISSTKTITSRLTRFIKSKYGSLKYQQSSRNPSSISAASLSNPSLSRSISTSNSKDLHNSTRINREQTFTSTGMLSTSTSVTSQLQSQLVQTIAPLLSSTQRDMGTSDCNEATRALLEVPGSLFFLRFFERDLERKFQEDVNVRNKKGNQRWSIVGDLARWESTMAPDSREEALTEDPGNITNALMYFLVGCIPAIFGIEHTKKYYHLWIAGFLFVTSVNLFVYDAYLGTLAKIKSPYFIINLSGIFIAAYYCVFATPVFKRGDNNAVNLCPTRGGAVRSIIFRVVSALVAVFEQEKRRRKIFLMERYLAQTLLFAGQELWKISDSAFLATVLKKELETKQPQLPNYMSMSAFSIEKAIPEERESVVAIVDSVNNVSSETQCADKSQRITEKVGSIPMFSFAKVKGVFKRLFTRTDEHRIRFPDHFRTLDEEFQKWDSKAFIQEIRAMFLITMVSDVLNVFIDVSSNLLDGSLRRRFERCYYENKAIYSYCKWPCVLWDNLGTVYHNISEITKTLITGVHVDKRRHVCGQSTTHAVVYKVSKKVVPSRDDSDETDVQTASAIANIPFDEPVSHGNTSGNHTTDVNTGTRRRTEVDPIVRLPLDGKLTSNESQPFAHSNPSTIKRSRSNTTSVTVTSGFDGPDRMSINNKIIAVSNTAVTELQRQSAMVIKSIAPLLQLQGRQMGTTNPNEATRALLDQPANVFCLNFRDRALETLYQEHSNLRNEKINKRAALIGICGIIAYTLQGLVAPSSRAEFITETPGNLIAAMVLGFIASINSLFGVDHVTKYYHRWLLAALPIVGVTTFVLNAYLGTIIKKNSTIFTPNLGEMMIVTFYVYFTTPVSKYVYSFHSPEACFRICLVLAAVITPLTWLIVAYAWYDNPVHEQEKRRRKIFLMERYLQATVLFEGQEVWRLQDSAILVTVLTSGYGCKEGLPNNSPSKTVTTNVTPGIAEKFESNTMAQLPVITEKNTGVEIEISPQTKETSYLSGLDFITRKFKSVDHNRLRFESEFQKFDQDFNKWDSHALIREIRVMFLATATDLSVFGYLLEKISKVGNLELADLQPAHFHNFHAYLMHTNNSDDGVGDEPHQRSFQVGSIETSIRKTVTVSNNHVARSRTLSHNSQLKSEEIPWQAHANASESNHLGTTSSLRTHSSIIDHHTAEDRLLHHQTSTRSFAAAVFKTVSEVPKQSILRAKTFKSILSLKGRDEGPSDPNEATRALLDMDSSACFLNFRERNLEREYQEYSNTKNEKMNTRSFIIVAVSMMVYIAQGLLIPASRAEAIVVSPGNSITVLFFAAMASVTTIFGMEHVKKYHHIWISIVLLLTGLNIFVVDAYVGTILKIDSPNFTTNLSEIILLTYFIMCLLLAVVITPLTWLIVAYAWYDNPAHYFSVLSTYSFVVIAALVQVHQQETRRRKIFLMERYLTTTVLFKDQQIWKVPDSSIIATAIAAEQGNNELPTYMPNLNSSPTNAPLKDIIEFPSSKSPSDFFSGLSIALKRKSNQVQPETEVENVKSRKGCCGLDFIARKLYPIDEYKQRYPVEFQKLDEDFEKWDRGGLMREIKVMFLVTALAEVANSFIDTTTYCKVAVPSKVLCGDLKDLIIRIRLCTAFISSFTLKTEPSL
ncbi:hypothetical protein HDU76_001505 [Blyttiomyces sp. JEL0837]|nr:hypothetical protein HDU76_001505 [Blyttiomyces sp. JEL0837]